ncbi:MAG: hypothetical protein ACR2LT_04855 [Pyrinomonadaceae bacterium]
MNIKLVRMIFLCSFCFFLFSQNSYSQLKKSQLFALADGQFEMRATYKFSDQDEPIVNFGGTVAVSVKGKELSIVVPVFNQPIFMKLTGNTFKGQLQSDGAIVEFQGEIVENNHTEGVFFGSFGQRKVTGLWTLKISKKKQDQENGT